MKSTDKPTSFDLPPTTFAAPLPVGKSPQTHVSRSNTSTKTKSKKLKLNYTTSKKPDDDTPRDFKRLLQRTQGLSDKHKTGRDDTDTALGSNQKNRSLAKQTTHSVTAPHTAKRPKETAASENPTLATPRILPGEKLSDFSARVNQALPLSGISRKSQPGGMNRKEREMMVGAERKTRMEKKMQRVQAAWRAEEVKRKEKEEEARDMEDEADAAAEWTGSGVGGGVDETGKKRKRGRRRPEHEDPWEQLKLKRERPRGLHDVVQAPPDFKGLSKGKFKIKDGARVDVANVPQAAGSLRRREELGETRKSIIESYRQMMEERRSSKV